VSAALGGQTVTVVFRDEDEDGEFTDSGERLAVPGCSAQPGAPSESGGNDQRALLPLRVFGPVELARARSWDQLEVDGWLVGAAAAVVRVEMDGPAAAWPDEHGRPHHVEVNALYRRG